MLYKLCKRVSYSIQINVFQNKIRQHNQNFYIISPNSVLPSKSKLPNVLKANVMFVTSATSDRLLVDAARRTFLNYYSNYVLNKKAFSRRPTDRLPIDVQLRIGRGTGLADPHVVVWGVCQCDLSHGDPPLGRQTQLKTLPSRKLRIQVVKILFPIQMTTHTSGFILPEVGSEV